MAVGEWNCGCGRPAITAAGTCGRFDCAVTTRTTPYPVMIPHGCVCPPDSEATCRGPLCPRQPIGGATS